MTQRPDLQSLLDEAFGSHGGAAECHGALTGLLCGDGAADRHDWTHALPADESRPHALSEEAGAAVKSLGEETARMLDGVEMNFAPLLPDDAEPLEERAAALRAWCQGFLYGFGLTFAPGRQQTLPDDVSEILGDVSEIASRELEATSGDPADETAYVEIVEYVRVGVQVIFDTLHPAAPGTGPVLH